MNPIASGASSTPSQRWLPALALAAAAALVLPAAAHDIVLVPEAGGVRVRMGHPGDWQSVDGERLLDLQVFNGGAGGVGADRQAALKRKGLDLLLAAPAADKAPMLVAARYDKGLWVKLPAVAGAKPQWRNTSRFMTPEPTA